MITARGIITLLVLAVLFALAVVWISRQGGWKGEGCGGNCSSCHQHCDTPEKTHSAHECPRTRPVRGHFCVTAHRSGRQRPR